MIYKLIIYIICFVLLWMWLYAVYASCCMHQKKGDFWAAYEKSLLSSSSLFFKYLSKALKRLMAIFSLCMKNQENNLKYSNMEFVSNFHIKQVEIVLSDFFRQPQFQEQRKDAETGYRELHFISNKIKDEDTSTQLLELALHNSFVENLNMNYKFIVHYDSMGDILVKM